MKVTTKLKYLRIAPRKMRLLTDAIKGKRIQEAANTLTFVRKKGCLPLSKLLKSALASAKNDFHLDEKNLYISQLLVDEGPRLKRVFPRSRGRADQIQKKMSHITLVLEEFDKVKDTNKKVENKKEEKVRSKDGKVKSEKEKVKTVKTEKGKKEEIKNNKI